MHFARAFVAAIFAAIAVAQGDKPNAFNVPTPYYSLTAGKSQTFTWHNIQGNTVTIKLRSGANGNLDQGQTIANSIHNDGSFTWSVPSNTVEGADYTLEIINDDDASEVNYTGQFVISSPVKAVASSSAAASSSASVASSSASASESASSASASASASASSSSASASASASASSSASASASSASVSASASASSASKSSSASATSDSAAKSASQSSVPTDNAAPMVKVGGSLLAVAAGFALAL
ncbi:MAG: hypothetical protein MMC23_009517 [Stictis urceolatum]|nr:hypothetical protein [Stictis urceolata]